jgi:formate hydrogenlyase subunit 3/multisubunit Na+/H+ antiporter MnhD subunit
MIFRARVCAFALSVRLESARRAPISMPSSIAMDIFRFLITLGVAILVIGLLWPVLGKIGLGRLPGDIVIRRDNFTFYFPIVTCLLVSVVLGLILWLVNR